MDFPIVCVVLLICKLYQDQESTVRTSTDDTEWFRIGRGIRQGCILSPQLFNLPSGQVEISTSIFQHIFDEIKTVEIFLKKLELDIDYNVSSTAAIALYDLRIRKLYHNVLLIFTNRSA